MTNPSTVSELAAEAQGSAELGAPIPHSSTIAETGQASPSIHSPPLLANKQPFDITSEDMWKALPPEILAQIVFTLIEADFRSGNPRWLQLFKTFRAVNRAWRDIADSAENSLYKLVLDLSRSSARHTAAELGLRVCYNRIQQAQATPLPFLPDVVLTEANGSLDQMGQMFLPFTSATLRIALSLFGSLQHTKIPYKDLANSWGDIFVKIAKSEMRLQDAPALVGKICKTFPKLEGRELLSVISRSIGQWESTTGKPDLFDVLLHLAAAISQKYPLATSDDMLTIGLYFLRQKVPPLEFTGLIATLQSILQSVTLPQWRLITNHVVPTGRDPKMKHPSTYIHALGALLSTGSKMDVALLDHVRKTLLHAPDFTTTEVINALSPKQAPNPKPSPSPWWAAVFS